MSWIILDLSPGGGFLISRPVGGLPPSPAGLPAPPRSKPPKSIRSPVAAIDLNARANHVVIDAFGADIVGAACRWDMILCGDVCYEAPMTGHILPWLRDMARTAEVWIADPGRAYVPRDGMTAFARFTVPTTRELEDRDSREVTLFRLLPAA